MSGWNSRNRLNKVSKHLCGQTCLHKLVDDFLAKTLAAREQPGAMVKEEAEDAKANTDASLTSDAAYLDSECSSRLITTPTPILPNRPVILPAVEVVAMPARPHIDELAVPLAEETQINAKRNWRVEAWKRERERETRTEDHRPATVARRRSNP